MKKKIVPILVLLLTVISVKMSLAWSNKDYCTDSQRGSIHDIIAREAYFDLKMYDPSMAQWITDWYDATETVEDTEADEYLMWTDNPDFNYQDWAAHNWDHHKYGYHGEQPPALFAGKVSMFKYKSAVCYLANWIKAGKPQGSADEKKAVKNAAIMSHYIADMSQAMHTDSTSTLGEESSEAGTTGRSYHSWYEGKSISCELMDELEEAIANTPYNISTRITDVEAAVKSLADYVNTDNGKPDVLSSEGDPVGAGYWYVVDTYYNNWNNGVYYLDSRGWDADLAAKTKEFLQQSTKLYGQLLYSIYQDAMDMATDGCNYVGNVGDVLISEVYYDPASGTDEAQWIELCNRADHPVDLSGWYFERPRNPVLKDRYFIEEGFLILPGYCVIIAHDGSSFASDPKSIVNDTDVCGSKNQPNSFGGCAAYQTLDETYDSVYNPDGEVMFSLDTDGDKLYLKDANGNEMDFVAWEGKEPGWDIYAETGKSIQRKKDSNGMLIDTDSPDDWISNAEPTPRGYLIGTTIKIEGCTSDSDCPEGQICCDGVCVTPACSSDADCDDGDACTIDTCKYAGTCNATCTHTEITECINDDGCCPAGCDSSNDNDCPSAVCGDGVCDYPEEDSNSCPDDCTCRYRRWIYECGNGSCDPCETAEQCPYDCSGTSTTSAFDLLITNSFESLNPFG